MPYHFAISIREIHHLHFAFFTCPLLCTRSLCKFFLAFASLLCLPLFAMCMKMAIFFVTIFVDIAECWCFFSLLFSFFCLTILPADISSMIQRCSSIASSIMIWLPLKRNIYSLSHWRFSWMSILSVLGNVLFVSREILSGANSYTKLFSLAFLLLLLNNFAIEDGGKNYRSPRIIITRKMH